MHSPRCAGEFSSRSLLYPPPRHKLLGAGRRCLINRTAADGVATVAHGDAGANVIEVEFVAPAAVDDLPVAAEAERVAVVNVDLVAVVVAVVVGAVVITVVIAVVVAVRVVLVVPTVAVVVLSVTVVVLDHVELVGVEVKHAQSGLGAAGVGGRVDTHGLDRVVTAAGDANRLAHLAGVAVLLGLL